MTPLVTAGAAATTSVSYEPTALDEPAGGSQSLRRARAYALFESAILGVLGASTPSAAGSSAGTTDRVNAVAQALGSSLASSGAGPAGVRALVGQVRGALDQASRALAGAGFSSDEILAYVAEFRSALSARLDALASEAAAAAPAADGTGARGSAMAATISITESGTLRLVTTEGDLVTIGFRERGGTELSGASAAGAAGIAAYASASSYAERRFAVSVQGSLNAGEREAISDVLGAVDQLAARFFSGDVAGAFASAATLGVDPTQIAGLALSLSASASLEVARTGPASAAAAAPSAPTVGAPGASAPVVVPANGAPATAAATDSTAGDAGASSPAAAAAAVLDFVRRALEALGTTTAQGRVGLPARAKLALLATAIGRSSLTTTETTAAGFLGRIVGATTAA